MWTYGGTFFSAEKLQFLSLFLTFFFMNVVKTAEELYGLFFAFFQEQSVHYLSISLISISPPPKAILSTNSIRYCSS